MACEKPPGHFCKFANLLSSTVGECCHCCESQLQWKKVDLRICRGGRRVFAGHDTCKRFYNSFVVWILGLSSDRPSVAEEWRRALVRLSVVQSRCHIFRVEQFCIPASLCLLKCILRRRLVFMRKHLSEGRPEIISKERERDRGRERGRERERERERERGEREGREREREESLVPTFRLPECCLAI